MSMIASGHRAVMLSILASGLFCFGMPKLSYGQPLGPEINPRNCDVTSIAGKESGGPSFELMNRTGRDITIGSVYIYPDYQSGPKIKDGRNYTLKDMESAYVATNCVSIVNVVVKLANNGGCYKGPREARLDNPSKPEIYLMDGKPARCP